LGSLDTTKGQNFTDKGTKFYTRG